MPCVFEKLGLKYLHHVFLMSQSTSLGGFAKLNVYSQENDPNLLHQDCICSVSPFDTKLAPFPLAHQHRTKQNQFQLQAEPPTNTNTKTENLTPVEQERLSQTFGGFTVKQRLREEVESIAFSQSRSRIFWILCRICPRRPLLLCYKCSQSQYEWI